MLISIREQSVVWGVRPKGVIHVGGHLGEEREEYKLNNWGNVVWIEAQPSLVEHLILITSGSGDRVIQAAIWDSPDKDLSLHISTNSESTSLLDFGTHKQDHPEIEFSMELPVKTITLEDLELPPTHDYLALDIQGVELRALKGFSNGLKNIKWICTEINTKEVYKECALIEDIDEFLNSHGFIRKVTRVTPFGWGDALYVRHEFVSGRNLNMITKLPIYYSGYVWLQIKSYLKAIKKRIFL
jgi:FkbM family methyltransferase